MHLVEETDPLGHVTAYSYDEHGQPVEITDAKGGKQQLEYDAAGLLVAHTDCSGKRTQWSYDERGRLVEARNALYESTRYHYTGGQLTSIEHPDQSAEQFDNDAEGRLRTHRNANFQETHYHYDGAGRISQRVDANRHIVSYVWDRLGRLAELHNENARIHRFDYDAAGKLLAEVHFDGARTDFGHDPATGVLRWIRQADGYTQVTYDPVGRLLERKVGMLVPTKDSVGRSIDRVDPASVRVDRYFYDGNGRLAEASNANIRLQSFYDPAGRLQAEHHHYLIDATGQANPTPRVAVWTYSHDELGNRIRTVRPDGHTLDWLTYGSGHVHGLLLDGEEVLQFERDDLHREVQRVQSNGIKERRQYDLVGRLKSQVYERAQPDNLRFDMPRLGRQYRYDQAGQLLRIDDDRRGPLDYSYDPAGRLRRAQGPLGEELFAFDPAGNMVDAPYNSMGRPLPGTTGIHPVLDNLIKEYAGTHYTWDARGNLIERRQDGEVTRFRWNASNQLEESSQLILQQRTRYWYDPLGRRIAKSTEPIVRVPDGAGSRYERNEYVRRMQAEQLGGVLFGWDGDQLAWESDHVPGRTVHYVYERQSFVPLLQACSPVKMEESLLQRPENVAKSYSGEDGLYDLSKDPLYNGDHTPGTDVEGHVVAPLDLCCFYQCDHLGTPHELSLRSGAIAWEAKYLSWGELKVMKQGSSTEIPVKNHLRFQGQYFDKETCLHYNRFRYYAPHAQRYIQSDPAGLAAGINTYQYVGGNPISFVDPNGLVKWFGSVKSVAAVAGAGAGGFKFDLTSECKCGVRMNIKGFASTLAGGVGLKYTGSAGESQFSDIFACPLATAANGPAGVLAASSIGGVRGASYGAMKLGSLSTGYPSLSEGLTGLDLSAGVYLGWSAVTSSSVTKCDACDPGK